MKKVLVAVCCVATLVGCGEHERSVESADPEQSSSVTFIDTGIAGVIMPAEAVAVGEPTSSTAAYDLPGWTFDDATKWISDHLPPDAIGRMQIRNAPRQVNGSQEWCWQSPDYPYEVLLISTFPSSPVNIMIAHTKDYPGGC